MASNLHPSKASGEFLENVLAKNTGVIKAVWARIAIARSISLPELPEETKKQDFGGTELAEKTIFGDQRNLFHAAFTVRYGRKIPDDEFFPKLCKSHLERGTELLRTDWELAGGRRDDFLLRLAEHLPTSTVPVATALQHPGVSDVIKLNVGTIADTKEKLVWELNRASNPHMAVVGTTGSGKTYFVKEMLAQIAEQTKGKLPFVFFDYARGDVAGDKAFLKATGAQVVSIPQTPAPLSAFPVCNTDLEITQQAYHLTKIFKDVAPGIGMRQEQRLVDAVQQAYRDTGGQPPDFYMLRTILEADGEDDSLMGVVRRLTDMNLFPSQMVDVALQAKDFATRSWVINLSTLAELRELVVFLVLDSLRSYFNRLPDQQVNNTTGTKELRCLFVIDEAHNFLPKDKAQVLEKGLRELRGKGVGIWMLTQNPDDLEQQHYNYSREVNFNMCLKVSDAKSKVLPGLYGVPPSDAKAWAAKLATFENEGLCRNPNSPKGFSKVNLRQFWQRKG
ncbi:MAG TPA: DndE family protein [Verrucomicrobiae bacterium]|nr:DndE family protein [Verrucomicrobiae bacterium]